MRARAAKKGGEKVPKTGSDPERQLVAYGGVAAIIGESERLEGTVIADCVNVACRLEGFCKEFGVRIGS